MSTTHQRHSRITTATATVATVLALATACSDVGTTDATETHGTTGPAETSRTPAPSPDAQKCGGTGIDQSATFTASHDILIDAPVKEVWELHTDVERWPEWQDAVTGIERLDSGTFDAESRFRWTTPVPESQFSPADTLTITSSVQELTPEQCVLWEGPAVGDSLTIEQGTHLWTFTDTNGGTLVHTEESWDAEAFDALEGQDAEAAEDMLGGGLVVWLEQLKTTAEAAA